MTIDYSVTISAFIDAFATRASYDDVTYCKKFTQSQNLQPEVCKRLTAIAKDGQISAEEAQTLDSDSQKFITGIAGRDGKALQWARIAHLQAHVVTKWWRWDADDQARAGMAMELGKYPGYMLAGADPEVKAFIIDRSKNDDVPFVRTIATIDLESLQLPLQLK